MSRGVSTRVNGGVSRGGRSSWRKPSTCHEYASAAFLYRQCAAKHETESASRIAYTVTLSAAAAEPEPPGAVGGPCTACTMIATHMIDMSHSVYACQT